MESAKPLTYQTIQALKMLKKFINLRSLKNLRGLQFSVTVAWMNKRYLQLKHALLARQPIFSHLAIVPAGNVTQS
jgi:hypothetical protein